MSNSSIFLPPSMLKNKMPCHCEVRERKHHERVVDAHCLVNKKKIENKLHTANAIRLYPVNLFEIERSSKDGQDGGDGFHLSKTSGLYYVNLAPKAPWEFCCCNKTSEEERKKAA